ALDNMTGEMAGLAKQVTVRGGVTAGGTATGAPVQLVAHFPMQYNFAKLHCERAENAAELEAALFSILGTKVKLAFTVVEEAPREVPAPERPAPAARRKINDRSDHPLVQRAVGLFGAR